MDGQADKVDATGVFFNVVIKCIKIIFSHNRLHPMKLIKLEIINFNYPIHSNKSFVWDFGTYRSSIYTTKI